MVDDTINLQDSQVQAAFGGVGVPAPVVQGFGNPAPNFLGLKFPEGKGPLIIALVIGGIVLFLFKDRIADFVGDRFGSRR